MHDEPMHRPFKNISEQKRKWHRQPLQPGHVVDMLNVDIESCRTHRVDNQNMHITVVPTDDARAIFLPECLLAFADHVMLRPKPLQGPVSPRCHCILTSLIYYKSITIKPR